MTTFERLKKVFAALMPDTDVSKVTRESKLGADLGITSITILLIVIGVEEEFGITFGNVRSDTFKTVGDVCDYIDERLEDGNLDG